MHFKFPVPPSHLDEHDHSNVCVCVCGGGGGGCHGAAQPGSTLTGPLILLKINMVYKLWKSPVSFFFCLIV